MCFDAMQRIHAFDTTDGVVLVSVGGLMPPMAVQRKLQSMLFIYTVSSLTMQGNTTNLLA